MAEIDDLRAEVADLKATVDIAGAALNVEIKRRQEKERELKQFRLLGDAVVDLCWKATPTGATTDDDVSAYILPKGTVHRLIGAAQCAGIPASFRGTGVSTDRDAVFRAAREQGGE